MNPQDNTGDGDDNQTTDPGNNPAIGGGVGNAPTNAQVSVAAEPSSQLPAVPPLPEAPTTQSETSTEPTAPANTEPGQPADNPALAQAIATASTAPASPVAAPTSSGGPEVLVLLDSLYSDATALLGRVEASGLKIAHDDAGDLVEALNIARTWLATKLTIYNPQHASLLRDIPSGPSV